MITSKNTTIGLRMERDLDARAAQSELFSSRLLRWTRATGCVTALWTSAAHTEPPAHALDKSHVTYSEPLVALRQLTWGTGGAEEQLVVNASKASWRDDAQEVILEGAVSLTRLRARAAVLTLLCDRATLSFVERQGAQQEKLPPQLRSLMLSGVVQLSAPGLKLSASRVSWSAGQPLELSGEVEGHWRGHHLAAEQVKVWPDEGRVALSQLRATIKLSPRREPLRQARER